MNKIGLVVALLALAGCAQPYGLTGVGDWLKMPDGSYAQLVSGGVCGDPQCFHQVTVTGTVHSNREQTLSSISDLRPVETEAAGAWLLGNVAAPVGAQALGGWVFARSLPRVPASSVSANAPTTVNTASTALGGSAVATGGNASAVSSAASEATAQATQNQTQMQRQSQTVKFDPPPPGTKPY